MFIPSPFVQLSVLTVINILISLVSPFFQLSICYLYFLPNHLYSFINKRYLPYLSKSLNLLNDNYISFLGSIPSSRPSPLLYLHLLHNLDHLPFPPDLSPAPVAVGPVCVMTEVCDLS